MLLPIMGEDVNRSQLDTLKNQLEQLRSQYAAMFNQINTLNSQLWMVNYQERQSKQCQNQKYTFWERMVTKRKEYHAAQVAVRSLDGLREQKLVLTSQLELAERQVAKEVAASGIEAKIATIENEIKALEKDIIDEESTVKLTTCVVGNFRRKQMVNDVICSR